MNCPTFTTWKSKHGEDIFNVDEEPSADEESYDNIIKG